MSDNYGKLVKDNVEKLYSDLPTDLDTLLPAKQNGEAFVFEAFGETCEITKQGIRLGGEDQIGVIGILISLYALHAKADVCIREPFKAFKDFPDTMPYVGAFATHTEHILVPHVEKIRNASERIMECLGGENAPSGMGGDFSFVLRPLPKIALCYIFYEADEDFPASVTCLYSNNASDFIPTDGLADVGEYTSKSILKLLS